MVGYTTADRGIVRCGRASFAMPSSDEDLKTRVAEAEPQFSTGIAAVLAPAPAALIKLVPG